MKFLHTLIATAVALALSGCSMTADCDAYETTSIVINIAEDKMAKASKFMSLLGSSAAEGMDFSFDLRNIKTLQANAETGQFTCSATMDVTTGSTGSTRSSAIRYTIELDKSNDVLVKVYGL